LNSLTRGVIFKSKGGEIKMNNKMGKNKKFGKVTRIMLSCVFMIWFLIFAVSCQSSTQPNNAVLQNQTQANDQTETNKKLAADIDARIAALGDANSLTLAKADDVKAIRASYEALTAEQKGFVTKLASLTAAEKKIADLQTAADNVYINTKYGFKFNLPISWKGFTIITDQWKGISLENPQKPEETGPIIYIRHPLWTSQNPRQDIPIMIFTLAQWKSLQQEKFAVGAAPMPPSELGGNSKYIFALPARYNYAFPTGFEEVEKILNNKPLEPIEPN
jgi:hypothetical protein